VPDSREGWAQAIEMMRSWHFEKKYRNDLLVLDFSKVRPKGKHSWNAKQAFWTKNHKLKMLLRNVHIKGAGMSPWSKHVCRSLFGGMRFGGWCKTKPRIATKKGQILKFLILSILNAWFFVECQQFGCGG
jgi:hypothetical protein